jgi:hypothetical protein
MVVRRGGTISTLAKNVARRTDRRTDNGSHICWTDTPDRMEKKNRKTSETSNISSVPYTLSRKLYSTTEQTHQPSLQSEHPQTNKQARRLLTQHNATLSSHDI